MSFHNAQTPEDLPPSHQGEYDGPSCGYAFYGDPCICTCGTCDVIDEPEEGESDDDDDRS